MQQYIDMFRDFILIHKGHAPTTAKAYGHDLKMFHSYLQQQSLRISVTDITQDQIYSYLSYLSNPDDGKQPNTVVSRARKLSSIKSFFRFLERHDYIEKNPTTYIDLPSIPVKEPDYLNKVEIQSLLQAVRHYSTPFFELRDEAIIELFLNTGIRVSELTNLQLHDINLKTNQLKVTRKGNKQQTLPLNKTANESLRKYEAHRPVSDSGYFFLSKRNTPLKANSVYYLVKKYLKLAGITKGTYGPHLLRHTCFTSLLANNVNPVVIQTLAGHSSFDTTRRYLHLNDHQLRDAVNKLSLKKGEL